MRVAFGTDERTGVTDAVRQALADLTSEVVAREMLEAFLTTEADGSERTNIERVEPPR